MSQLAITRITPFTAWCTAMHLYLFLKNPVKYDENKCIKAGLMLRQQGLPSETTTSDYSNNMVRATTFVYHSLL